MTGWTVNILNVDANASVEEAEDGTLITLAPVDLFKVELAFVSKWYEIAYWKKDFSPQMVTQQVDLVKDADNGKVPKEKRRSKRKILS